MLLELVAGYVCIIVILLAFAEYKNKFVLGIFASTLLFILGGWMLTDGIQMQTGQVINITETANETTLGASELTGTRDNVTGDYSEDANFSQTGSKFSSSAETVSYTYEDLPDNPIISVTSTSSLLCFLFGLYFLFHYAINALNKKGQ